MTKDTEKDVFEGFINDNQGFATVSVGYFIGEEETIMKYLCNIHTNLPHGFPKLKKLNGEAILDEEGNYTLNVGTYVDGPKKVTVKEVTKEYQENIGITRGLERTATKYHDLLEQNHDLKTRLKYNEKLLEESKTEFKDHLTRYREIPQSDEIERILEFVNVGDLEKTLEK